MIDHVVIRVRDLGPSRRIYAEALGVLGYRVVKEFPGFIGLGQAGKPDVWIGQAEPHTRGMHVALLAATRAAVDAFHAAGLKAGGRDNGAPGLRAHYHADYYGAFLLDPEGNNIEAVCHDPRG